MCNGPITLAFIFNFLLCSLSHRNAFFMPFTTPRLWKPTLKLKQTSNADVAAPHGGAQVYLTGPASTHALRFCSTLPFCIRSFAKSRRQTVANLSPSAAAGSRNAARSIPTGHFIAWHHLRRARPLSLSAACDPFSLCKIVVRLSCQQNSGQLQQEIYTVFDRIYTHKSQYV